MLKDLYVSRRGQLRSAPFFFIAGLVAAGCSQPEPSSAAHSEEAAQASEPAAIVVSVAPYQKLAQRIAEGIATVGVLVGEGQSPETYEVTPRQMEMLTEVEILVGVGMPFEHVLFDKIRAVSPDIEVVLLAEVSLGSEHHDHDSDPHRWLNPLNMAADVGFIANALSKRFDVHGMTIAERLTAVFDEMKALDKRIAEKLAPYKGRSFYVYHPAYGAFAEQYGLKQVAFEDEGKAPGVKHADALVKAMTDAGVTTLFVQPQTAPANAERLAALAGATVVTLDPLSSDYAANLESIADRIVESFRAVEPVPLNSDEGDAR